MYRRRVRPLALPCFVMPRRHEGSSPSDRHCKTKEGPRALPFSSIKANPNFQRTYASTMEVFFHLIRPQKIIIEFLHYKNQGRFSHYKDDTPPRYHPFLLTFRRCSLSNHCINWSKVIAQPLFPPICEFELNITYQCTYLIDGWVGLDGCHPYNPFHPVFPQTPTTLLSLGQNQLIMNEHKEKISHQINHHPITIIGF